VIVRLASLALAACLPFGLAAGCGGESTPAAESAHGRAHKASPNEAKASDDDNAEKGSEEEPESRMRSACDDGTCFTCGTGSCPLGWYCDESASGSPACSWLPDCGKKPDCACVSKTLGSACSCAEEGGGPHVKCK
jgi:hypothetical protein